MTAVAEDEVALSVGLGVAGWAPRLSAGLDDGLQGVGDAVAVGGVAVPVLEPDQLADLVANEVVGECDAGVVALLVADQHHPVVRSRGVGQSFGVLDGRGHRLLDQDVLASLNGSDGQWDVELVRDGDDHCVDLVVGEHRVVVGECGGRLVDGGHSLTKIVGGVADRVQLRGLGLAHGREVCRLCDLAGAEDADVEGGGGQVDRSLARWVR